MTMEGYQYDLVVLVADKNQQATVDALLSERSRSLGIPKLRFVIRHHQRKDSGCLCEGVEFLRLYLRQSRHALLLFDHEGCGREREDASEIAKALKQQLSNSGWGDRADVVILQPELEAWVWSPSPEVDRVLGWTGAHPPLREWLRTQGCWSTGKAKPDKPKWALEMALREKRVIRSSSIYKEIASRVALGACQDTTFQDFKRILQIWFTTELDASRRKGQLREDD